MLFFSLFYCLLTTKQAPFYILYGLLQVNNLQKFPFCSTLYFDRFFYRLSFRIMSNSLDSLNTKSLETKTVIFFVKTNSLQFFFKLNNNFMLVKKSQENVLVFWSLKESNWKNWNAQDFGYCIMILWNKNIAFICVRKSRVVHNKVWLKLVYYPE